MADVGGVLRQEIVRLARRELRAELAPFKKARAEQRQAIALLKREAKELRQAVASLRKSNFSFKVTTAPATAGRNLRFVAKGLKAQRTRLGLSANEYGKLVGVSHQTVRNWEEGVSKPSASDLAIIDGLRRTSKQAAQLALQQIKARAR
jgi:DNA-binding transcriptional regulator YiaG